jgi:two-component system, chemotaxis family, CheB/CheR fusion protein
MVLKMLTPIEAEVSSELGRWYLRRMLPYRTQDNRIAGVVISFTDITDSKRAADKVNEARIYAEGTVQTVRQPLLVLDENLRIQSANPAFYELFGVTPAQTGGQLVYELGNGEWDIPQLRTLLEEVLPKGQAFSDIEIEHEFRDIGLRCMLLSGSKLSREGDREGLILVAFEDITERRRAETHRAVLLGELNHRVKNTLATVQAIAVQTLSNSKSIKEARSTFEARLMALSRAHDLLTQESWEGADLSIVVRKAIEPLDAEQGRFHIEGPNVQLAPSAALSFAMALHELATNAAKYGALSNEQGHVSIAWQIKDGGEERRLHMRWTEQGGPLVVPPTREGFGSLLVGHALAQELGGKVQIDYKSSGVVCMIDAPMQTGP